MNINDFISYPDNAGSYALNQVPNFSLETQNKCTVQIRLGNFSQLFTGSYRPNPQSDMIVADFKDIVREKVSTLYPRGSVFVQSNHTQWFSAVWTQGNDTVTIQFLVSNARLKSVDRLYIWAQSHFLTNQPTEKLTTKESPEWLTYMAGSTITVKARVYPIGGMHNDYILSNGGSGVRTVDVSCSRIKQAVGAQAQLQGYYDIVLVNNGREKATQRYIVRRLTGTEHYFMFVNALGGIDTLICRGDNILQPEENFNTGRLGAKRVSLDDTESTRTWQQNLRFQWRERNWIHELLSEKQQAYIHHTSSGDSEEIIVTGMEMKVGDRGKMAVASFNYMMADADDIPSYTTKETSAGLKKSSLRHAEDIIIEESEVLDPQESGEEPDPEDPEDPQEPGSGDPEQNQDTEEEVEP